MSMPHVLYLKKQINALLSIASSSSVNILTDFGISICLPNKVDSQLFKSMQNSQHYYIQCRAVRRRRRPHVGVAPAPFSWRVHVMLYTSYMLLDFCNAVYSEAWTLTKSSKNDEGVFLHSPWYLNETRRRQSKVFSWTILWKWKLMLKVSHGTSLGIWLIKRMVQWKISTACTVIHAYKVPK